MMKAIVTGHSRGLGAAIAGDFMSRGIPVLGIARRKNTQLAEQYPEFFTEEKIDLADATALASWLAGDALANFIAGAHAVILVNNAGIVQPVGPIGTQDIGVIAQAVNLNVATPFMLAAAVTAASGNSADTRIVHVSSGAGRSAYPGWSVYCATKAALDHHARSVSLDGTPNLRICSLAPGVIDTEMQSEIRATPLAHFPLRAKFDDLKREGRLVSPVDCAARLVDYVLSPGFGKTPVVDLREVAV